MLLADKTHSNAIVECLDFLNKEVVWSNLYLKISGYCIGNKLVGVC